jgi:YD repeat-containing protein
MGSTVFTCDQDGRQNFIQLFLGPTDYRAWNVVSTGGTDESLTWFDFNNDGLLTAVREQAGLDVAFGYDGVLPREVSVGGTPLFSVAYPVDPDPPAGCVGCPLPVPVGVSDHATGTSMTYTLDDRYRVASSTVHWPGLADATNTFRYNDAGDVVEHTDSQGNLASMTHDHWGFIRSLSEQGKKGIQASHSTLGDPRSFLQSFLSSGGVQTAGESLQLNSHTQPVRVQTTGTLGNFGSETRSYDSAARPTGVHDHDFAQSEETFFENAPGNVVRQVTNNGNPRLGQTCTLPDVPLQGWVSCK